MRATLLRLSFPLAVSIAVILSYYAGPDAYLLWATANLSILEVVTGIVLVITLITSLNTCWLSGKYDNKLLRRWLILYCIAIFYFVGEDQNWGQYYFNTQASDWFMANNKEQETNLHNVSSWFNQKPRLVTELWCIIAGILVPLGWSKPKPLTQSFVPSILWPDVRVLPVAILAVTVTLPERLWKRLGISASANCIMFA